MHYPPLEDTATFPMSAVYHETDRAPTGPWAMPGIYTIRLRANGKEYTQPLELKMDPRIKTKNADLQQQHDLSLRCYEDLQKCAVGLKELDHLLIQMKAMESKATEKHKASLIALQQNLQELKGGGRKKNEEHFVSCSLSLKSVFDILQNADVAPTTQCIRAVEMAHSQFESVWKKWLDLANQAKGLGIL
jgi:hypothetical protein